MASGGTARGEPMSVRQFQAIRDMIYARLGLFFDDAKTEFIGKRIGMRMEALGIDRIDDYVFHLRFLDNGGSEMQALANLVTTNETYMFREYDQLQAFADCCLPEVIERRERSGIRRLRIWSAGCSSGEEPYTIAIILREVMHDADEWDIQILATDIDENRLEMARVGVYGEYAVREVPDEYFDRHLSQVDAGLFRIQADTARSVKIRHLNLHDRRAMEDVRDMDFVFCRNVLIYFDANSSRSVLDHFHRCLNPGGFLYLGHSESVSRVSTLFAIRRCGPHLVYWKENKSS